MSICSSRKIDIFFVLFLLLFLILCPLLGENRLCRLANRHSNRHRALFNGHSSKNEST